jgi:glycosyltransferase involved in cell wall biosynthesis
MSTPAAHRLVVRTGKSYAVDFAIDFGQRNAELRRGVMTPLRRLVRWGDAVTWLPGQFDLIHSWNAVPLTRKPHLISFEDYLPRTPPDRYTGWVERAVRPRLHREQCVALLALSEYGARQFRWQNRDYPGLSELEGKLEVLYPGVRLRRSDPKSAPDVLRLLFVGNDHMRKGAPALARAHAELRRRGVPVETTIVSALDWDADDYIGPPSAELVEAEGRRLAGDGLRVIEGLPNDRVLELMDEATFLVLPTLHDTFGFVALEALATGTPVIASATCALPEAVDDGDTGFLLPLENEAHVGKWAWTYRNSDPGYEVAYLEAIEGMAAAMADRLSGFWEDSRDDYERMSAAAIARLQERFGLDRARDRLEALYARCAERL